MSGSESRALPLARTRRSGGSWSGIDERSRVFQVAFDLTPLPGFLFSRSRLDHANEAARQLLRSGRLGESGLPHLQRLVYGPPGPGPRLLEAPPRRWRVLKAEAFPRTLRLADYRVCFLAEENSPALAGTDLLAASRLNRSQRLIADLLTDGLTNREIAERLGIAAETVRKQVGRILAKTSTHTRTEFVAMVLRR
ncbi:MAG: helix-turn-helix transcriptional regulator [Thermoanaerobaculia bacterium]